MATKVLNARLKLIYKTWAEWQENLNFVPNKGEPCIVYAPANSAAFQHEPALLMKVGDGATAFKDLPWMQGIASDVHDWAKKDALAWSDLSEDFKVALSSFITAGASAQTEYRLNKVGEVYTLQKREYNAEDETWGNWTNIENSTIDISGKVDSEIISTNGKALIFNESDGGGAKFEHTDGTWSYLGVNDGGKTGLTGQLYSVDHGNGNVGTRLNLTSNGFFYTNGKSNATYSANDEIATKGDIAALGQALTYLGMTELASGEALAQAQARAVADYQTTHLGYTLAAGAVIIIDTAEYIYNGTTWQEFGNEGLYETKAEAQASHDELDKRIDDLADIAVSGNVNDLVQTDGDTLIIDCNV